MKYLAQLALLAVLGLAAVAAQEAADGPKSFILTNATVHLVEDAKDESVSLTNAEIHVEVPTAVQKLANSRMRRQAAPPPPPPKNKKKSAKAPPAKKQRKQQAEEDSDDDDGPNYNVGTGGIGGKNVGGTGVNAINGASVVNGHSTKTQIKAHTVNKATHNTIHYAPVNVHYAKAYMRHPGGKKKKKQPESEEEEEEDDDDDNDK